MMFAQMADWAGSKMAPDNPFAGYAQQFAGARNFAKLLQPQQPGQQPGVQPNTTPNVQPPSSSSIASQNPFDPNYQPLQLPSNDPNLSMGSEDAINDIRDQIFLPGIDAKVDSNNIVTLTRKLPAQSNVGVPAKKQPSKNLAPQNLSNSTTNPFWYRG